MSIYKNKIKIQSKIINLKYIILKEHMLKISHRKIDEPHNVYNMQIKNAHLIII